MLLWFKAFHLVFMVTWFAGLFYLPRLFVYHAQTQDAPGHERFLVMERKLFIIMTIGAVFTALFGIILYTYFDTVPRWFQIKMLLVATLAGYHLYCYRIMLHFRERNNTRSHVFYRWFNEVPALLLIAIVVLAVLKQQLA